MGATLRTFDIVQVAEVAFEERFKLTACAEILDHARVFDAIIWHLDFNAAQCR
jgi:hypothetical protein